MARRAKGTGSITKRSDGRYMARYKGKTVYGRTLPECTNKLDQLKLDEDNKPEAIVMIKDAFEKWLHYKTLYLKPTSMDRLERTVNANIIPKIGELSCTELTEDLVLDHVLRPMIAKNLSYSTVKKAQDAMCDFSRWASHPSRGYIKKDPLASFKKLSQTAVQSIGGIGYRALESEEDHSEVAYLDADSRERFISACRAKMANGKDRYCYGEHYLLMLYTGLRMGELLALKWKDVDLEKRKIYVCSNLSQIKDRNPQSSTYGKKILQVNPYTKTGHPRYVPLGDMAYEAICKIKETAFTSPTYVCANRRGELVSPRIFETTLDRVYDLADIHLRVGTNSHALRHTFASMCFETGMPVKMVSELLGHSTVRLTMDTYVHLITEKNLEDVPELTSLR